jgi:hypothetical protein
MLITLIQPQTRTGARLTIGVFEIRAAGVIRSGLLVNTPARSPSVMVGP